MNKEKYVSVEDKKKYAEMYKIYDCYTSYYCPTCDNIESVNIITDDGFCPVCKTTSTKDLKLIISNEDYKEIVKGCPGMFKKTFVCQNCHEVSDFEEYVENDFTCFNCGSDELIEDENAVKNYSNSEYENWEDDELEVVCQNCGEAFTCNDNDKIQCPHCNFIQEDEDYELDIPDDVMEDLYESLDNYD